MPEIKNPDPSRVTIVEGDVLDVETLKSAMQGQDGVYANLADDLRAIDTEVAQITVEGAKGTGHERHA